MFASRCPLVVALMLSACASSPPLPNAGVVTRPGGQPAPLTLTQRVTPDPISNEDAARIAALSLQAKRLVDVFTNSEAIFTRDDQHVVFVSDRGGVSQLYMADATRPDSPARRLVSGSERMTPVMMTPDGRSLLYLSDKGSDENWSIWKVGLDGSEPRELTPGERMNRDNAFVPELAPDTVYFSGRRKEEVSSAVYAVPLSGGEVRRLYRDDKPGFLTDVSRDGQHALFLRYLSGSENYLVHLDPTSGETRPLYPLGAEKVAVYDARFSPDGRTVYVATDGGGEQALLLALDARSGKELGRYVEQNPATATFPFNCIAVAKTGDALALTLNAGNRGELRLLDARTLRPRARIDLPLGQGRIQDFSADGRRLTATWSTPATPGDVWVIDTKTGQVAPLRAEPRPSLEKVPPVEASIAEIRAHDGLRLPINVYLPKQRSGRLPVIVHYHGGPAASAKIRWSAVVAFFVSQGYAWVEPNVRGSGGFGRAFEEADNGRRRLDAFQDVETTGRWVAEQPWADPGRMIMYGGSYGGYTVLIGLTRMQELWRAGVSLYAITNLKTFMATTTGFIREIFLLEMGDPDKDAAFLQSISPLEDVGRIVDPLFVYAGENDPRVPRSESDQLVRALRERRVPVEYMVAENEGHSLSRKENLIEFLARAARFLEKHALSSPPAGPRPGTSGAAAPPSSPR
jgi:dipeptidyl aminopeptidase/acylaminoacyl peptidase